VVVDQLSKVRSASSDRWLVAWQIKNLGQETLKILSARLPHSRFRCDERKFDTAVGVGPEQSARLELEVKCEEPSGTIVENAFLILRVLWLDEPWRILARLRVSVNKKDEPETITELVTTQRVGFSELVKGKN
jgi:hypothetical protein